MEIAITGIKAKTLKDQQTREIELSWTIDGAAQPPVVTTAEAAEEFRGRIPVLVMIIMASIYRQNAPGKSITIPEIN